MEAHPKQGSVTRTEAPAAPDEAPAKQAVNLRMDRKMVHRLKIHALQNGVSISDVVFALLEANLPEYDVSQR